MSLPDEPSQIAELRVCRARNRSTESYVQHWIAKVVREHGQELAVIIAPPSGQHAYLHQCQCQTLFPLNIVY